MTTVSIDTAKILPAEVAGRMDVITEWAEQAAFGAIADWLGSLGYPVSGDVAPETAVAVRELFEEFVRMMALNNAEISAMNEEA